MGTMLNINCTSCEYNDTFYVGQGFLSMRELGSVIKDLTRQEAKDIRENFEGEDYSEKVVTTINLMHCAKCNRLEVKLRFDYSTSGECTSHIPKCKKCSSEMKDAEKNLSKIKCPDCSNKTLQSENHGNWD